MSKDCPTGYIWSDQLGRCIMTNPLAGLKACPTGEYYSIKTDSCQKRATCADDEYFDIISNGCTKRNPAATYVRPGSAAFDWSPYVTTQGRIGKQCLRPAKNGACGRGYRMRMYGGEPCCYVVSAPARKRPAKKRKSPTKKRKTATRRR